MDPTTQDGEPRSKDDVMEAMAKMEETYMKPADVSEHFFDKGLQRWVAGPQESGRGTRTSRTSDVGCKETAG